MRKTNAVMLAACLLGALGAAGCGQKEGAVQAELLDDVVLAAEPAGTEAPADTAEPAGVEASTETEPSFPKDPGWTELTVSDQAMQIDDVLYLPGITVEEEMERVRNSAVSYDYDYDGDQEVLPEEQPYLILYREDHPWVVIQAINPFEDTGKLSALPVCRIEVTEESVKNGYFLDGRSYEELTALSVDEVRAMKEQFGGYELFELSDAEEGKVTLTNEGDDVLPAALWTGYEIGTLQFYTFYTDPGTGEVTGFMVKPSMEVTWNKTGEEE